MGILQSRLLRGIGAALITGMGLALIIGSGGGGEAPPAPPPPLITTQPAAQTVPDGATANFSVVASGIAPLSYQWRKNGVAISGATSEALGVSAPYSDSGAVFSVVVSNSVGSVTSADAALTVTPLAPTVNSQPASQTVQIGSAATFTVAVSGGTGPIAYQWRRAGSAISGATSTSYTLTAAASGDNGVAFTVAITSPSGTLVSDPATLTVTSAPPAPPITTQPQNQTVALGQTATFSVGAGGSGPLTYQWSRNSLAIAGATSASYTTAATVAGDDGAIFKVAVANAAGTTNSNNASLTISNLPAATVVQLAAGFFHSVARKSDGSVWTWGATGNGLRGIGSEAATLLPSKAKNADGSAFNGVADVSAGYSHTMAAKSDGSLWSWGYTYGCGIGDGTSAGRTSPTRVLDTAGTPIASVAQVSAANNYSLARKTDGSAWAWGCEVYGRLGIGVIAGKLYPTAVLAPGGGGFAGVSKIVGGINHAQALMTDGTLYAWGLNNYGQIGNGTAINSSLPVRTEISPGVALTGVVAIAAGYDHSLAVLSNGTAYGWGYNASGQLGNGTTTNQPRPTLVKDAAGNALTGIVAVAAGAYYSMFLKSDGTVWASGYNNIGQLGDNSTAANQVNPVVVKDAAGAPFGNVVEVALTHYHTLVRRNDGTVWAWGNNGYAQLGDLTTANRRNPVQVPISGP